MGLGTESGGVSLDLGASTAACIANGAAWALVSVIDRICLDMKKKFGDNLQCVITGGDAVAVNAVLRERYILEPGLVLEGLAITSDDDL